MMPIHAVSLRVPGPPKGRRGRVPAGARDRIQAMREAERSGGRLAVLRFAVDVILLLKDLAVDPRVAREDKLVAGAAAAYLVSPVDLVPGVIPVIGQLDDLVVALLAARRLLTGAGYDVIYGLWRGSEEGLALLLMLSGVKR
jgi:uncharacterized membrane protein YkvA (DUF1232 family)